MRALRWSALIVPLLLLGALVVRVNFLQRSGWLLEGDDSLSTLMALDILDHGDRPIMLRNQTYASAWEPYLMALSYALFGISRMSAKLPALLASMGTVAATWLLTRELAGPVAARFATALLALPPTYILVQTLKPWAPYTDVIFFGLLGLYGTARLVREPERRRAWGWAAFAGSMLGLSFWMHPVAAFFMVPAALTVALRVRGRLLTESTAAGALGFLVGALPVWIYNLQTAGATFRFFRRGLVASSAGAAPDRLAILGEWLRFDLPRAAGLSNPWDAFEPVIWWGLLAILVPAVAWAAFARRWRPPTARPSDPAVLLLITIPFVFLMSGFGGPALNADRVDATGRYATPIWFALAIILGTALAALWPGRRLVASGAAAVVLACSAYGWIRTDASWAFQSPYFTRLAVDHGPVLKVLRDQGVAHVWTNHFLGKPLMFDARAAGQTVIAYDWFDVFVGGGIDRYPEHLSLVEQAPRAAYVMASTEAKTIVEEALDELGVRYDRTSANGYVVVVPTSRVVHPSEIGERLDY